jgi:hypothetical protein
MNFSILKNYLIKFLKLPAGASQFSKATVRTEK